MNIILLILSIVLMWAGVFSADLMLFLLGVVDLLLVLQLMENDELRQRLEKVDGGQ